MKRLVVYLSRGRGDRDVRRLEKGIIVLVALYVLLAAAVVVRGVVSILVS